MQLEGIPAIVTGGASGLGAATALALAEAGAKVAIFDINLEGAQAVAKRTGGIAVHCDITDANVAEAAVASARDQIGIARLLVNCAGGGRARRVVNREGTMPLDAFSRVITMNLVGTFNMIRLVAADMIKSEPGEDGERGVVINTTSVAAYEGQIGQSAYTAAKGGILALTIQLAREFAQFGVRFNAIAPGIFETPLLGNLPPEGQAELARAIPFPARLGQPSEYADLVKQIVTNRYLNGETIRLDGAVRLAPR